MRIFISILVVMIIFFQIQSYLYPQLRYNSWADRIRHPFDTRLRFQVAQVDPEFGLTREEVIQLSQEAIQIWHQGAQHSNLLTYDDNAQLKIKLIYDDRQKEYIAQRNTEQKLKKDEENQQRQANNIVSMHQVLAQKKKSLLQQKQQLELQFLDIQYQQQNPNLGTDEQFNLRQQFNTLQQQSSQLTNELLYLEQQINRFNLDLNVFQNNMNQHKFNIVQARQRFPPREFHKGSFDGKEIHVYQFAEKSDLRLTLAHELGHALGMTHHQDSRGLMYPVLQDQNFEHFKLHSSDLQLLSAR